MDDEERRKFIVDNLKKLTEFTVIGPEFVISLVTYGLIGDEESDLLLNSSTPNITRAFRLYNKTARRWSSTQFEDFKRVLEETGNVTALQVFNNYEMKSITVMQCIPESEEQSSESTNKSPLEQPANTGGTKKSTTTGNNVSKISKGRQIKSGTAELSSLVEKSRRMEKIDVRELMNKIDKKDIDLFQEEIEVAWKLVRTFSQDELYALFTNEETRVNDSVVWINDVSVALGEQFIPRGRQLAEFRGKFGELKGLTFFEVTFTGREYALGLLWEDLVREMKEGNSRGPVTVAIREATRRIEGGYYTGWKFIQELEDQVMRRQRSCCARKESGHAGVTAIYVGLLDWVTEGVELWNFDITATPLSALPFYVRYSRTVTHTLLRKILQNKKQDLENEKNLMAVLRSLVILSSDRYKSDEQICFSVVAAFLEENIHSIPIEFTSLTRTVLSLGASKINCTVNEVGGAFTALIPHLKSTTNCDVKTWGVVLIEVIKVTPCCEISAVLRELQIIMKTREEVFEEVLMSEEVFDQWRERFWSVYRREREESYEWMCGLRHFLTFYSSVFGGDKLEWMKKGGWKLVGSIPVEIAAVLQGEEMKESYPNNNKLVERFTELVRELFGLEDVTFVSEIGGSFCYETEWEWEALINLLGGGGGDILQGGTFPSLRYFYPSIFAPLIRVLIRMFGVEWTRTYLRTHRLWKLIPSTVKYRRDTVALYGSLLHSAIELGEWDEVRKRAFPGLVLSWRNSEGKTALEVAKETKPDVNDRHRIIIYLAHLVSSVKR